MDRAFSVLQKVLQQKGVAAGAVSGLVLTKANERIRELLPSHAAELRAAAFREGVLVIEAQGSAARNACQSAQEAILSALKDLPWDTVIQSLRVTVVGD